MEKKVEWTSAAVLLLLLQGFLVCDAVEIQASSNPSAVGQTLTLSLSPTPTLKSGSWAVGESLILNWLGTQQAVFPSHINRVSVNGVTGALTLNSTKVTDSGVYIVQSNDPQLRASISISVLESVSKVTLSMNKTDLMEWSGSAVIKCSVSSGTSLSFLWMNGTSEVTTGDRVELTDGNSTLTIANVSRYDQGPFRCFVSNAVSSGSSDPVNISVSYGPDNMGFTVNGQDTTTSFVVGSNLTMLCSAQSSPPALLQWASRGNLTDVTGPLLELVHVTEDQSGLYSCLASNNHTKIFNNVTKSIEIKSSISRCDQHAGNVFLLLLLLLVGIVSSLPEHLLGVFGYCKHSQGKGKTNICSIEGCNHTLLSYLNLPKSQSNPVREGREKFLTEEKLKGRMESSFVLVLTVLTTTLLGRSSSQALRASENPVPVGNNVTLHSTTTVTNGFWLYDGQWIVFISSALPMINEPWSTRVEYNKTTSSLILRSVTLEDSGLYSLQGVTNNHRADLTLSVQVPVSNVSLRANAIDLVEHNDTAVLMCSVSKGTSLSYKWLKDDSMITAGGNVELSDGNVSLTINNVTRFDGGSYICNVSNGLNHEASQPVYLNVSYGPSNVTLTVSSTNENHHQTGSNITLSCSAESRPPAIIQWIFNGAPLNHSGKELTLENLTLSHSGVYQCLLHNTVTGRYNSVNIFISAIDPITSVEITVTEPAILHDSFTQHCAVSGPNETIQWFKNGSLVYADNTTEFGPNNKTLTFNPVQHSHSGDYQCLASNAVSEMTSNSHTVHVNFGPETPVIHGPTQAKTGSHVVFNCSSMSVPPSTYTWMYKKSVIANTSHLVIYNLTLNMSGEYTCVAHNNVTGEKSNITKTLTVFEAIESVRIRTNSIPILHENFTLICDVVGPYDTIYWMKDNSTLLMGSDDMNTTHMNTTHMSNTHMNTTHMNTTHMNTTHMNTTHLNTHYMNTTHMNTHYMNTTHMNTTHMNTKYMNTTHMNTTHMNTHYMNTTHMNTTYMNTTHMNTHYMNTTHMNTTHMNTTHMNTTYMNTTYVYATHLNTTHLNTTHMNSTNDPNMTSHLYYHIENNKLHLTPLMMESDGAYRCVAKNQFSHQKSPDYVLLVNFGPLDVSISGPESAVENSSVTLSCSAVSRPESTYYWYLDDHSNPISNGSVLTFSATDEHEGSYICDARNSVTNITKSETHMFTIATSIIHLPSQAGVMLTTLFGLIATRLFY
ncbi:carcinoembryonic antigen-related cell adhesion molecule 1 [Gouania willdenowi]|uniref:carcinoembryonic antigen-related cell adhesion molecule 1 n=1 Tax=Gouania willdenowi TaxID=441366 RepID=UPI001056195E|nr:hemicentin-1-like [Gouania willdenowi]